MAVGRINLIDPIDVVSKFGANYNGMPDYEKMRIFAELTVVRRGKSILVATDTVKIEKDSENISINMLGFEQSKNAPFTNFHTTSWTNNTSANNNYEGFGIQSINVNLTPSAVPIVNIEFVDIKGMALINRGADSPYAVLYDFPPPIFELTIKGYYGKKLSYTLHLLEQNTRFDGTSGNYYISAKFTSRTFSPLTDILFKYAMVIPYVNQQTDIPDLTEDDDDIPPIPTNTFELIQSLKERNERLAKLNNTSEELETTKESQLKITNADSLLSSLNEFSRSLKNYSGNAVIIIQNNDALTSPQSKEPLLIFPSNVDA
ncbi:MAG: hypothetical protein HC836_44830, partial [Richelia sp. RM2_1_2]|nr:hypothetical protein [Richelia sp. RM2_1_2]